MKHRIVASGSTGQTKCTCGKGFASVKLAAQHVQEEQGQKDVRALDRAARTFFRSVVELERLGKLR